MISTYSMRHRYEQFRRIQNRQGRWQYNAPSAQNFFWTVFWSTKWRVGDDGCAIFLFFKKTRHSIQCPFSYLLRKLTTYECVSFSYPQNRPVDDSHWILGLRNDYDMEKRTFKLPHGDFARILLDSFDISKDVTPSKTPLPAKWKSESMMVKLHLMKYII